MPEYIQYDKDGLIIKKWYSVDPSTIEKLENILKIDRDTYNLITRYHKVKDGRVIEMTQEEKDTLDAPIIAEQERIEALRLSIKTKLEGLGLTSEEADYIIGSGI